MERTKMTAEIKQEIIERIKRADKTLEKIFNSLNDETLFDHAVSAQPIIINEEFLDSISKSEEANKAESPSSKDILSVPTDIITTGNKTAQDYPAVQRFKDRCIQNGICPSFSRFSATILESNKQPSYLKIELTVSNIDAIRDVFSPTKK